METGIGVLTTFLSYPNDEQANQPLEKTPDSIGTPTRHEREALCRHAEISFMSIRIMKSKLSFSTG